MDNMRFPDVNPSGMFATDRETLWQTITLHVIYQTMRFSVRVHSSQTVAALAENTSDYLFRAGYSSLDPRKIYFYRVDMMGSISRVNEGIPLHMIFQHGDNVAMDVSMQFVR